MRYVSLNPGTSEPLLNLARARMREEEFISLFRAFLSLLAIAEAEDLDYVRSKLLPHRLSLDRDPPAPSCETAQATPNQFLSSPHAMENPQQSDVRPAVGSGQSRSADSAPRSTTSEIADSDLFAIFTTLEDQSSPHEQAASTDTDMLDCGEDNTVAPTASTSIIQSSMPSLFVNTSNTPTATDTSDPANNNMSDIAGTPLSQVVRHTECSSESPSQASSKWSMSPVLDSRYRWSASSPPFTRYVRDFKRLDSLYGGISARGLTNINDIIKLGDHFLREDVVSFVETFRQGWRPEGLWYHTPLSNPSTGSSVVEKMLKSLRCAEIIEYDSAVDPVRLRMARIFLYHYFEQKCIDMRKDPNLLNRPPQGKRISSVVLDVILKEMYSPHDQQTSLQVSKQRRQSLKDHKKLGKRWSILANHLGIGIIVTCSRGLETHTNNTKFTERMIMALLTYILNVYPQGVQTSRTADPLVQCMIDGAPPLIWPATETLAAIDRYEQQEEKECYAKKEELQPVAPPKSFVPLISMQEVLQSRTALQ